MDSILIVSSTEKGRDMLTRLLRASGPARLVTAGNGGEARRQLPHGDFALVVINAPLSDEFGHVLAADAAQTTAAGILLLVRAEQADETAARVEDAGVVVVSKPVSAPFFYQAVKIVQAVRRRILGLKRENVKLQQKIEDIRLVNRAKCILIQHLKLTEEQAHRYIEKQAMDLRISRREVAEGILQAYEN